jgi:hypothetical protein
MRTVERVFERDALARVRPLRVPSGAVLGWLVDVQAGRLPEGPFSSEAEAIRRAVDAEHTWRRRRGVSAPSDRMDTRERGRTWTWTR